MKKIVPFLLAALAAASCAKYDDYSGSSWWYSSERVAYYVENYATVLIPDNLLQLESAMTFEAYVDDIASAQSYKTGGKSIWTPGAVWTVGEGNLLVGLSITKEEADSTWTLAWDGGDYAIYSATFPTTWKMTVRMLPGPDAGDSVEDGWRRHASWEVSDFSGSRTEDKGYSCAFRSDGTLTYSFAEDNLSLYGYSSWDYCEGTLLFDIFRDGSAIDRCRIAFHGSSYDREFTNNLL